MNRLRLMLMLHAATLAVFVAGPATPSAKALPASHPLTMAISGAGEIYGPASSVAFVRLRAAGVTAILISIGWSGIAPAQEPTLWDPANPDDPNYNWSSADARIKAIAAAGFQPIVAVDDAPAWARLSPAYSVSPPQADKLGQFTRAAAQRYDGTHSGLPRVRYWQIWNEPNISLFFAPQFDSRTRKFTSPEIYRDMVNASSESIHGVHPDNVVIAGGTAPFRDITPEVQALDPDWGPLKFMRRFLCIDDAGRPTCDKTVSFDVWATHPYTSGGPTHHAVLKYDVSLGDLPEMRATLAAGIRTGHVKSARTVRFWVTEFSWDSNPPDRCSPPMGLLKRWVPEAFYRMWANGIDLITWFQLMDEPITTSFYQSGLFFRSPSFAMPRPKPFLAGFRFPFVALRRGSRVYVWAHTPFGRPARVAVEQTFKGGWTRVKELRTDRIGIAQAVVNAKPIGRFRAILRSNGEKSIPFSMRVPPDHFFNPFGQTSFLEPNGKKCSS